jgi:hypothetical protein
VIQSGIDCSLIERIRRDSHRLSNMGIMSIQKVVVGEVSETGGNVDMNCFFVRPISFLLPRSGPFYERCVCKISYSFILFCGMQFKGMEWQTGLAGEFKLSNVHSMHAWPS